MLKICKTQCTQCTCPELLVSTWNSAGTENTRQALLEGTTAPLLFIRRCYVIATTPTQDTHYFTSPPNLGTFSNEVRGLLILYAFYYIKRQPVQRRYNGRLPELYSSIRNDRIGQFTSLHGIAISGVNFR